jgi:hypothetical protein
MTDPRSLIDATTIKKACELLGWDNATLAHRAGLPLDVVEWLERPGCDYGSPIPKQRIIQAFEKHGLELTPDGGVRRKEPVRPPKPSKPRAAASKSVAPPSAPSRSVPRSKVWPYF